ncbi:MAG TPA: prepilin-type N-terminal cleavage/methylation domain-containing protein, partial [Polyangiaceae bacterium]|nr:prepilin-type N-terminal cleavage/methylation domain-containing protein [Polyangiaceae bacterium]
MARCTGFSKPARAARRGGRAGFTLVELMVAMTGGLFLSIVVF